MLVDEKDYGVNPRVFFFLEHTVQDASLLASGERRAISRKMLYVEIDGSGNARHLHYAPCLDYRALTPEDPELATLLSLPEAAWITHDVEKSAIGYAVSQVVPDHLREVKDRRINWIKKTRDAVKDRLIKEINYWDNRANQLLAQEQAGKSADIRHAARLTSN